MGERRTRGLAFAACAAIALAVAAAFVLEHRLVSSGRLPISGRPLVWLFGLDDLLFVVALISASAVGAALAFRRPEHPVGWLFLALGGSLALTGVLEGYAGLYESGVAAALAEITFITWFVLLALILHLTPTGRPLWRWVPPATVAVGTVWIVTALLDLQPMRAVAGVLTAVALVVAGLSLLIRFRRAAGVERRQLLWLAVAVVPLPVFVAIAFYAADEHPVLLLIATSGFIVVIPVATGLAIAQYHLYDVERILSRAVAYLLVSGVLGFTFAAVAITAGQVIGGRSDSQIPAVLGTLSAVALAGPVYRAFQEAVDRRFNRRRFDTVQLIRAFVRSPGGRTVEEVLRQALGDPALRVAYWVGDRHQWVTDTGESVGPGTGHHVVVRRLDQDVARISWLARLDRDLVQVAATEALPELENAGLRAAISLQLVEVRESRARIAAAQLAERRRIERDLHDGAQQHLLALAMNLRATQLNALTRTTDNPANPNRTVGSATALNQAIDCAIVELRAAVAELRELANGLYPVGDAGLAPAAEDLANRLPLLVDLDVTTTRLPAAVEATAWFIICEAVTNAVKHANATRLTVAATVEYERLVVRVEDDGRGGADPDGRGLRGLTDRAEALNGRLTIATAPTGTRLTAELPVSREVED
ncbi:histidine kinase [Kribbella sp. CA-247076]|uniref:sensor histidine kinase n=1 Tax=Kribbella sp. CA-247076 TaxID=3239941 RepID=UPI003D8D1378